MGGVSRSVPYQSQQAVLNKLKITKWIFC